MTIPGPQGWEAKQWEFQGPRTNLPALEVSRTKSRSKGMGKVTLGPNNWLIITESPELPGNPVEE